MARPAGRLDLHHVGAEVGEDLPQSRPRSLVRSRTRYGRSRSTWVARRLVLDAAGGCQHHGPRLRDGAPQRRVAHTKTAVKEVVMGLLDDLLGQLAGGRPFRTVAVSRGCEQRRPRHEPRPDGAHAGRARDAANRRSDPSAGFGREGTGGGLMASSVRCSAARSAVAAVVAAASARCRAVQRAGFGDQARSWVSSGENQLLPAGALEQIFGQEVHRDRAPRRSQRGGHLRGPAAHARGREPRDPAGRDAER